MLYHLIEQYDLYRKYQMHSIVEMYLCMYFELHT